MKVVVDTTKPRGAAVRFLTALPVAAGSMVICLVKIGPLATLVIVVCTLAAVSLLLRLLTSLSFRRSNSSVTATPRVAIRAEASMHQKAGTMSISTSAVEWSPLHGSLAPLTLPISKIAEAKIAPVRAFMIRAARLTFTTVDGREVKMTATAPPEVLEHTLNSVRLRSASCGPQ